MKVRVHRGGPEVGGCCVEVEHRGDRLVLDVGAPWPANGDEHVVLPTVPGLADGSDPRLRGVLVAHPHLDHRGLAGRVSPRVPVFIERQAAAILAAARPFTPSGAPIVPTAYLEDRQPLHLGQFTITPQLVDHCGVDAYAFAVDAGDERLFYAGRLRARGRQSSLFEGLVAHPPSGVDTLLLEGAQVTARAASPDVTAPTTGEAAGPGASSESQLEVELARTFLATDGLVVVVSAAQHLDRLVTAYRACLRSGRTLLVDLYAATVAQATGRPTLPQPGFPQLGVYVADGQRRAVETSGESRRTDDVAAHRVELDELAAHPDEYVVLTGGSTIPELLRCGALAQDGVVVWSRAPRDLRDRSGRLLAAQLAAAAVPFVEHHVCDRPSGADLSRLVAAIGPRQVVPIGTEAAGLPDGLWWEVAPTFRTGSTRQSIQSRMSA